MHPYLWTGWVEVHSYTCASCGRVWRTESGTMPTDARGANLYCPYVDEGDGSPDPCAPFQVVVVGQVSQRRPSHYWCERGSHVSDGAPCTQHRAMGLRRAQRTARACEHCGDDFVPARSDARYCSGRCRVSAHRARRRAA